MSERLGSCVKMAVDADALTNDPSATKIVTRRLYLEVCDPEFTDLAQFMLLVSTSLLLTGCVCLSVGQSRARAGGEVLRAGKSRTGPTEKTAELRCTTAAARH